ncbi:MAG: hypothetical protein LUH40_02230, partial [Clostridiales bacterium]|nr:hypothetical protein [Clostridiales bacterium]
MKKNEKNVDEYRSERKDRLNSQSKKADKKHNSHQGAKRVASKVCRIVVTVVVIVALVGVSLNFFGIPQKVLKAVTIDGESYSMSELSCYFMLAYNNVYSYAYSYDSNYGDGYGLMLTGFDITLSPDDQTTTNDDGETVTWSEYFMEEAIEQMAAVKRYYALAIESGIELSDEDLEEIEESMDSFRDASRSGYSVSRYISKIYGKGVNESLMEKVITEQQYVSVYQEQRQAEIEAGIGEDEINAVYAEDPTAYDVVDFRWFTIDVEEEEEDETSEDAATEETTETEETEDTTAEDTSETEEEEDEPIAEELLAQEFIDDVQSQSNYDVETFKATVLEYADPESDEY